ncbi:tRNA1(Val) (adenine(37)-N6)-methyltransferase [Antarcticimicrobium sediminis]|uniref:Methyltransferase domain-containing protein n=1 Tax=Antarcticimicrobium sediminis TaxID=2546227 RepID=A0A4R5EXX7_9RHOB|nr:methyltransferase domain-containing protein [Antarcticimicrobium sediminis]TDE39657.1 methyltransferase domain-containing protein [Antarcticimicrobium sediminis]
MSVFSEDELSRDVFLGGRIVLHQPRRGYRAGVDPLLLAAAVPARPGQAVLELGCGGGAAILALGARVPDLALAGVELQPGYADLARRNAVQNGLDLKVVCGDLSELPPDLRQRQFDHVIANPPYFRAGAHVAATDPGRRTALGEATPLADWVAAAARRLVPRGYLHVIQRSDRLPDLIAGCAGRLGSIEVLPLAARDGRAPDLLILRARKGGRAAFRLHAPLILHEGAHHMRDGESYRAEVAQVLRDGAALRWPA